MPCVRIVRALLDESACSGLQLSPFLDLRGVILQMGAHDALHEVRQVGAPIAQSTDNEVRALLRLPTEIDRPTICQFGRDEKGLLVSLQRAPPHFGADAFRWGCILGRHGWHRWHGVLWMRFFQIGIERCPVRFVEAFLFHACYLLFGLMGWDCLVVIGACFCCSRRRRTRLT